jgi:hypothetical protein
MGVVRDDAQKLKRVLEAQIGETVTHSTLMAALGERSNRYMEAVHSLRAALGVRRFSKAGRLRSVKSVGYVLLPASENAK